jgi:hypothetical protein
MRHLYAARRVACVHVYVFSGPTIQLFVEGSADIFQGNERFAARLCRDDVLIDGGIIGQEGIETDRDGEVCHGANSSLGVTPRSLSVPFPMYDARSSDDDPMG